MSLWGGCAKIVAELPGGQMKKYFLKASNFIVTATGGICINESLLIPHTGCHREDWPRHVRGRIREHESLECCFASHGTLRVDMGKVQK